MSKTRKRMLKSAELATGVVKPPPEPPRVITHVGVPFFSEPEEWPAYIDAMRKTLARSQYGVLVDDPTCERTPFADEQARFEAFGMAYQQWLITEGAERNAEAPAAAFERLRKQFRNWKPPAEQAA